MPSRSQKNGFRRKSWYVLTPENIIRKQSTMVYTKIPNTRGNQGVPRTFVTTFQAETGWPQLEPSGNRVYFCFVHAGRSLILVSFRLLFSPPYKRALLRGDT